MVQPADVQPPLTLWSHVWRYALVVVLSAGAWVELAIWQWQNARAWFFADLAIGILCLALVGWRRRFPFAVAMTISVLGAVSATSTGPGVLAVVSLSTRRRRREIVPVAVVTVIGALAFDWFSPTSQDQQFITWPIIVASIAVTIGWGMYIGSRRELLATLRERADIAESEQSARMAQARTAERARIAREMHDVLAHRISLVAMHAGALTYRKDLDADEMRSTAAVIQENSHQALVELREVLGILRDGPGGAAPELPQPSAEDMPALLDEARRSGMRIEAGNVVALEGIPETLGRTLYRVVQEGLTNARKHAPDTLVTVEIGGGPDDGLSVEVRNPLRVGTVDDGATPDSGLGLIGLSERTALAGGRMSHLVTAEREFVLSVWLPWHA